jgi:hypothetical protein
MTTQHAQPGLNRRATIALLVISLAVLVTISYALPFFSPQRPILSKVSVSGVDIVVTYNNGTVESKMDVNCTRTNVAIISVFDVMLDNFQISYEYYELMKGYIITSINNESGWNYWVDGAFPADPVNLYPVSNNSLIEWKQA